ncbi:Glycosyltransferase involved in cell wall bisynthesis [Abditibacterium utsteinense]|uniref:Glycosyltransferase involved in cell wall bisynthesis n=1 Tax=Abditibacterium utsteinense TaxID=1960156 RepID=A0A2S8SS98_9BACT|nr:glycosyltransferase [Abditibacterium utsteinense]PQV63683.1 Glycosyltransferase involved in cell wall bisynthesis [Abditibacterium utsteinense]
MKVAIVHDYLMQMGGAEKVVEVLHSLFPDAPVYTSAYDREAMPASYRSWEIHTTFLQRLPWKRKTHRAALLLYPAAFESFDLSGFDLVISSSSSFAKGIITQPDTVHICYTHAPMRFAWTPRSYMKEERVSMMTRTLLAPVLHYLRTWDALAAMRVDYYLANSRTVAQRIRKFYRRDCDVVHPPVETSRFRISPQIDDYYLMVTRLAPYKRLDLAVEACTRLNRPLKIVGAGRYAQELKKIAGPSVEFLGRVSDKALPDLLARAKAYIMPGEEDFGIAPVEANASGRPVIAYAAGGALDSQIDGVTGVFFSEPTVESLVDAIQRADAINFDPQKIRSHAEKFDTECFKIHIQRVIKKVMDAKAAEKNVPFEENGASQLHSTVAMEPLNEAAQINRIQRKYVSHD